MRLSFVVQFHIIILSQVFSLSYWNSYIICIHCSISHNYIIIKSFHWDIEILNSSLGMTISFRSRCFAVTQLVSLWVSWCFEPSPRHMGLEHVPSSLCSTQRYNSTGKKRRKKGYGNICWWWWLWCKRGVKRGSARRSSLKGRERAIVSQTNIGTVSKATLGKLPRDGVERIWAFPSA